MTSRGSIVDAQDAALAGVCGGEVVDFQAVTAFAAEGLEGLLPFRVGRPVRGAVSGGEDLVLMVMSLLDNGADLILRRFVLNLGGS